VGNLIREKSKERIVPEKIYLDKKIDDSGSCKILFKINVNIDKYSTGKIIVHENDSLFQLAQRFSIQNKLGE